MMFDKRRRLIQGGILLLGFIHGLIFICIVPPWQHYDEPGHFEYAWLIANRGGLPEAGEYDQSMRRELSASMIENKFFSGFGYTPNLVAQTQPIWIGISQTGDEPVYYWLVSLPLRLVRTTDLTFQLYVARSVSLAFYLITIVAAIGLLAEIAPEGSVFRWLVPVTLVCLPGFTDLMTSVNNDVGAVALFSLFLWVCARMTRRGFHWSLGLYGLALMTLCIGTKGTVLSVVFLFPLAVILSSTHGRWQRLALVLYALVWVIGILLLFSSNGVSSWYLRMPGQDYGREKSALAIDGQYALRLENTEDHATRLYQPLESAQVESLRGKQVTLGAWIWADQPYRGRVLLLEDSFRAQGNIVEVGAIPMFFSFTVAVDQNTDFVNILLQSSTNQLSTGNTIYIDGIVCVPGDFAHRGLPVFMNESGSKIQWDDEELNNLARNVSFEQPWIQIRPAVIKAAGGVWLTKTSQTVTSLGDWSSSRWYYQETLKNLLQTFWGKFGWGHIKLLDGKLYAPLAVMTGIGCLGALAYLIRRRDRIDWRQFGPLTLALVFGWGITLGRGIESLSGQIFIGSARYAYPVIVPTLILLTAGWWDAWRLLGRMIRIPVSKAAWLFVLIFVFLNVSSWASIIDYYRQLP